MSYLVLAAGDEEPNPLIPYIPEVVMGAVFFAILVWLVAKFVVPNFEKAYAERTSAIEGGIAEATRAQEEAQAALEQYNAQLAEARHDATRIREEAREQASAIVAEARTQAEAEAERRTAAAAAQIEAEKAAALASLKSEVGTIATRLAEQIVGEALEDEVRQRGTVDRFIADLESESAN